MRNAAKVLIVLLQIALITPQMASEATIPSLTGMASWYAEFSPGINKYTANMEIFDHDLLTCASWDFPFNTILKVTNIASGKEVTVRVNDRGPAKRYYEEGRIIDLTMAAFKKIADTDQGLVKVKVEVAKTF